MARLFIDGFEGGDTGLWSTWSSYGKASASSGANISGSYYVSMSAYSISKGLDSSVSTLYGAFKVQPQSRDSSTRDICGFADSGGTVTASLRWTSNGGKVKLRIGSSDVATGTVDIALGQTALIEFKYIPLNSGGNVTVKVNGITDINYTGDTTNGLENTLTFILGRCGGDNPDSYYDDVVLDDANYPGNTRIQGILPTGAGTTTQWDPSTGNNYACVDERPYGDSDYVSTNTTNEIDTYAFGNLSGSIASIKAVQLQARAAYEGTPTPTHVQLGCRSGGADYFSTDKTPGVSFAFITKILETDPATAAAWTESNINSAEFGIKATA